MERSIRSIYYGFRPYRLISGLVAQLGERSVRIREVEGSNPFRSTKTHRYELFWFKNVFGLTKKLPQR